MVFIHALGIDPSGFVPWILDYQRAKQDFRSALYASLHHLSLTKSKAWDLIEAKTSRDMRIQCIATGRTKMKKMLQLNIGARTLTLQIRRQNGTAALAIAYLILMQFHTCPTTQAFYFLVFMDGK